MLQPASDTANHGAPGLSQQQVGAAISKLISATIGDVAVVFARSAAHKHYSLADIEWMILPAVVTGQVYVAELEHKEHGARAPVAVVLWASVSDETDQRLTATVGQKIRLRPDEWKSGDIHWIVDVAGDVQVIASALRQLAATVFKDKSVKVAVAAAGDHAGISDLHKIVHATPKSDIMASAG